MQAPESQRRTSRVGRAIWSALREIASRPLPLIGLTVITAFVLVAIFAPLIAPYPFDAISRDAHQPPSTAHLFGTDSLGRDVFSRVVFGSREILVLPAITTALALVLGVSLGLAMADMAGWFDTIASRLMDGLLAIPALLLALVVLGSVGSSSAGLIFVIVLLYVPLVARVVRSAALGLRSAGYVEAARLRGEPRTYILFREILPGVLPAVIVEGALRFSYAIFLVTSLGFLGLGVQPPSPDWGRMVNEARDSFDQAPWALWFPAAAIAMLVIAVNLLSDGLRRVFRYEGPLR
ncbi:MAG TPA: ABC transporter permease [Candidatus Limnocylindrales bacterium]|nr:ABC transporter permease [Candidatus Limnocylindrales bacterium]